MGGGGLGEEWGEARGMVGEGLHRQREGRANEKDREGSALSPWNPTLLLLSQVMLDLKPDNVLVTRQGTAVLTDFGISRVITALRATKQSQVMGTYNFM